jgi:hypothetical protein
VAELRIYNDAADVGSFADLYEELYEKWFAGQGLPTGIQITGVQLDGATGAITLTWTSDLNDPTDDDNGRMVDLEIEGTPPQERGAQLLYFLTPTHGHFQQINPHRVCNRHSGRANAGIRSPEGRRIPGSNGIETDSLPERNLLEKLYLFFI